jgi:hypothetical protein
MARTYQELLDDARIILQDTDSERYRYDNTTLLRALNRGLQEIARLRPEVFRDQYDDDADDVIVPEITSSDLGNEFDLPMMFFGSMIYFVTGSTEFLDDEFAVDNRAMTLLSQFKQQVVGL